MNPCLLILAKSTFCFFGKVSSLTRSELASLIDHTLLVPDAVSGDIERLCGEAISYGFYSVCINPLWVPLASQILRNERSIVCSVIGFPLGATNCMGQEAAEAVALGAGELDMVIPIGYLKDGNIPEASASIREVVHSSADKPVKVIIETCLLTDEEKILACRIAMDSGASWVKTSTGFSTGGATVSDVTLMRDTVRQTLGVKASGGIRTLVDALVMIEAGASRLGCSRSIDIIEALDV
ncbi:deoxyribose-phosphate aldolase [Candidatus Fermentibacteria bacterium]|nr:MAG: deoxyribose-phosphate aldolase [Candidatus Fermentibacteria bacterium]